MKEVNVSEDCEKSNESSDKLNTKVPFDDVVEKELGVGLYQVLFVFLIALTNFTTYCTFEYIFVAAKIPYRCRITECGETSKDAFFEPEWLSNAVPESSAGFSSCDRYAPVSGNETLEFCSATIFNQSTTVKCDSYVYGTNTSLVNEFDLGCREWYRTMAGTLNGVGIVLALPLSGYLSDKLGRRFVLFACVFSCGILGMVKAFSVNYEMYLVLQILQTTFGSGIHSTATIFSAELVLPKHRVIAICVCSIFACLGKSMVGLEAMFVQNWRHLLVFLHIPCFVPLVYCWIVPESPRWLISKGKYERAEKEIKFIARINSTQISEKSMKILLSPESASSKQVKELAGFALVKAIITSRMLLRRTIITIIWFFCSMMIYYGLTINSTSLSGNSQLNFILVALVQIPGFLYMHLVMDRFGRRFMMFSGYCLSAVCNLSFSFISKDQYIPGLVIYLLGQLATAGVSASIFVYIAELYPTVCRHRMLGFCSMIGHFGQVLAPMTPALMEYWRGLPTAIFGCLGFICALLVFFQPETKGCKLPETIAEAEKVGFKNTDK